MCRRPTLASLKVKVRQGAGRKKVCGNAQEYVHHLAVYYGAQGLIDLANERI